MQTLLIVLIAFASVSGIFAWISFGKIVEAEKTIAQMKIQSEALTVQALVDELRSLYGTPLNETLIGSGTCEELEYGITTTYNLYVLDYGNYAVPVIDVAEFPEPLLTRDVIIECANVPEDITTTFLPTSAILFPASLLANITIVGPGSNNFLFKEFDLPYPNYATTYFAPNLLITFRITGGFDESVNSWNINGVARFAIHRVNHIS